MSYDEDYEPTPAQVIREGWRWLPAAIVASVVLFIVLAVNIIGWQEFGWWRGTRAADKSYSITVHSQAYQTTLISRMEARLQDISDIGTLRAGEAADDPTQASQRSQQLAALRTFCTDAAQLTSGNPAASQLYPVAQANCLAGTVIPNAPLVK